MRREYILAYFRNTYALLWIYTAHIIILYDRPVAYSLDHQFNFRIFFQCSGLSAPAAAKYDQLLT